MKARKASDTEVLRLRARVVALERQIEVERTRVDRYAEILFRAGAQREGVSTEAHLREPNLTEPLPEVVVRAVHARSEPNTPLRTELLSRAVEMLGAGVTDKDVASRILDGEEIEL